MNYYEHHIGDYAEATAHLTFVEDAAYSRLIRKYYATELPLPADVAAVQRLVGARAPEEKDAVAQVLQEFFTLEADGWHNQRCDKEIEKYQEGEPDRQLRKTNEQQRLKKHREERQRLFHGLHDVGVYPAYNVPMAQLRVLFAEHCNGVGNAHETLHETLQPPYQATGHETPATATHTPDTNSQSPVPNTHTPDTRHQSISLSQSARASNESVPRESPPEVTNGKGGEGNGRILTPEAAMSIPLRNAGVKVTSMHPTLCAWVKDGYTLDQLLGALAIARAAKGETVEIHAKYLDTVLRDPSNWPAINRGKPNGANGHAAPARRTTGAMTHAEMHALLDSVTDPDSEDFA